MPAKTFIVTDADSNEIAGTLIYQSFSKNAIFTPTDKLPALKGITVKITTGVKNTSGIPLATDFVWSFTTAAAAAPEVIAVSPANAAVDVDTNTSIAAQFSEDIDPATLIG